MRVSFPFGPVWFSFRPRRPRVPFGCVIAYFVLVWLGMLSLLFEGAFTRR